MVGAGVLPYAIHKGTVYLLLGQERNVSGWEDRNKWADFGGGIEHGETVLDAAVREFQEETLGILFNSKKAARQWIEENTTSVEERPGYTMYIVRFPAYDKNMPKYYNNIYKFLEMSCSSKRSDYLSLGGCSKSLFEKRRIKWVALDSLYSMNLRPAFKETMKETMKKSKLM